MKKTIGSTVTQFVYDGRNPVQELNGANPPAATANLLTGLGIDEYFSRSDSSGTMAFLRDALGSTIALVNAAGAIATSYTGACPERSRREPFGRTTVSGGNANPYQFTGRENDGTGLYYYRARYYSPSYQRFVSQDPRGPGAGSPKLYGYAGNNPPNLIDPLGLWSITISAYEGYGFSIAFGENPNGSFFANGGIGAGIGGGFVFNPNGTSPGYDRLPCGGTGFHGDVGLLGGFGAALGPFGVDFPIEFALDFPSGTPLDSGLGGPQGSVEPLPDEWGLRLGGGLNVVTVGYVW